jgi:hypothetical protein
MVLPLMTLNSVVFGRASGSRPGHPSEDSSEAAECAAVQLHKPAAVTYRCVSTPLSSRIVRRLARQRQDDSTIRPVWHPWKRSLSE